MLYYYYDNGGIVLYYRQKVLLALLEKFNNSLSKTELQKYLLLFTQGQTDKSFDFVPYRYGCYSFQATKDLEYLKEKKYLKNQNFWSLENHNEKYIDLLTDFDRMLLFKLYRQFKDITGDNLIKYVYLNYPYYTLNSTIKDRILSEKELEKINNIINANFDLKNQEETLFTIGYEGITLEEYVNKLIKNNIKVLIDVRKNPLSRKFGFSKLQLRSTVENFGIEYIHIPELGIESEQRDNLKTIEDYNILFGKYEKTLDNKLNELQKINNFIKDKKRVALTCFEKDVRMCHRTRIKNKLKEISDSFFKIVEL